MSDCRIVLEKAKKEVAWTAYGMTEQGKHYLHSRLFPSREKGVELNSEGPTLILSFGLGLGYQWQKGKWPKQAVEVHVVAEDWCFVQENLLAIAEILGRTATKVGPSDTPVLFAADGEAPLYVHDNNRASASLATVFEPQEGSPKDKAVFHYFQPVVRLAPEQVPDLAELFKRASARDQGSATKEHFAFIWHDHFLINAYRASQGRGWRILRHILPPWPHAPGAEAGAVFIAGASPGLNATLDDPQNRRQLQQKAIVIATDSAEAIVRGYGLEPHIVVSVDASPFGTNQLAFQPPSGQDRALRITNPVVAPALFGPKDLVLLRRHPLEQLLEQFLVIDPLFLPGNHVGAVALELGRALQPQEIWIAGMDLSFARGVTYGRPSMYNSLFLRRQQRLSSLESQAMEQIRRSYAYAPPLSENPEGRLLYRRHGLDQGLAELKETLTAKEGSPLKAKIHFCHLPEPIARELKQPSQQQIKIQTTSPLPRQIHDSLATFEVDSNTLKEFLRRLHHWFQEPKLRTAMLHHWPQNPRHELLLGRLLGKHRLWAI